MHSMRSAQRQVELRRLGNQLPLLGKANSLCTIVKCCVFGLFVPRRARVKDIPGYRRSGKIGVASRRCTTLPVAPLVAEKIRTPAFHAFSSALSRFFVKHLNKNRFTDMMSDPLRFTSGLPI